MHTKELFALAALHLIEAERDRTARRRARKAAAPRAMRAGLALALCFCLQWQGVAAFAAVASRSAVTAPETISVPHGVFEISCLTRGPAALEVTGASHEPTRRHADPRVSCLSATSPAALRSVRTSTPRTAYPPRERLRRAVSHSDDDPPA